MDAPCDLYVTKDRQRLCEENDPEVGFLLHRKGQVLQMDEEARYDVVAYLEGRQREQREQERAERQRVLADAKAVQQSEVEDKAMPGPREIQPIPAVVPKVTEDETEDSAASEPVLPLEPRRPGSGRRTNP